MCVCIINQPINNNNATTKVMKKQLPTSLGVSNYLGNSPQQQQISSNDYHLSSLGPRANRIIPLSIFITVNRSTSIAVSFAWETLCMKREKYQISCEDQLNYFFFLLFAFCFLLFLSLFLGRGKTYATACDLFLITMQAVTSGGVTVLMYQLG